MRLLIPAALLAVYCLVMTGCKAIEADLGDDPDSPALMSQDWSATSVPGDDHAP